MLKASTLVEEYTRECLLRGVKPEPPLITSHWLRRWMRQFRVSLRRPNKRYKVPLAILQERLQIFWLNLVRLRTFIRLVFGYDPHMTNVDQSPYHKNEAGSQDAMTLSVKGDTQLSAERKPRGYTGALDIQHDKVLGFRRGEPRLANSRT